MTAPLVDCCKPLFGPAPSGWTWFHNHDCPVSPGIKIRQRPPAKETEHRSAIHRAEQSRRGIPAAAIAPKHPLAVHDSCKGPSPCGRCAWLRGLDTPEARYVDYWLDWEAM